jgi:hypothetical protein
MLANLFRTRNNPKHSRLPQQDSESLDSNRLLPSSPPTASCLLKDTVLDRSRRDVSIAVKTLIISTVVYLGAGLWLVSSFRNATFVADVDDVCLHHVSRYCKQAQDGHDRNTDKASAGRERREAWLARPVI